MWIILQHERETNKTTCWKKADTFAFHLLPRLVCIIVTQGTCYCLWAFWKTKVLILGFMKTAIMIEELKRIFHFSQWMLLFNFLKRFLLHFLINHQRNKQNMICQFNNLSTIHWPGVFVEGFKCFLLSLCTAAQ